ncbi:hypothetical protein ACPV4B_12040 [Vibrio parahaemolyticus]
MPLLAFESHHHQDIDYLLAPIKSGDSKAYLTCNITKEYCQIIGGTQDYPQMVTLPVDNTWKLKPGQWSMSASSFKEYWNKKKSLTDANKRSELEVNYDEDRRYPTLRALTVDDALIYIRTKEASAAHLDFLAFSQADAHDRFQVDDVKTLLDIADIYRPFDAFEINKQQGTITTECDQQKLSHALPERIEPACDLMLNHESAAQLAHLCETTTAEAIQIYTDDERAIFSDGHRMLSSSLLSLQAYKQRQIVKYKKELRLIIEIAGFNDQVRSYQSIALLKQSNEALLYVDKQCVMLASLVPETGENRFLKVKDIKVTQPTVYRINLSELSKIPIKDITSMDSVKVQMLKSPQGDYKLGFYNEKNKDHPYQSVHDVAPAPDRFADTLQAKETLELKQRESGGACSIEAQGDLLGYDDE